MKSSQLTGVNRTYINHTKALGTGNLLELNYSIFF